MSDSAEPTFSAGKHQSKLTVVLLVVVVVFAAFALWNNWSEVADAWQEIGWWDLAASAVLAALGMLFAGWSWLSVLSALDHRVKMRDGLTIFFAGQLGKYIPGSVWPAVIQSELGSRSRIPRTSMLASYVVAMMVAVSTGSLVGLLVLVGDARDSLLVAVCAAAIGGFALALIVYDGRWLTRFATWAGNRVKREVPPLGSAGKRLAPAAVLHVFAWVFLGLHAWTIARPLGAGWDQMTPTVGGFAFAFVAGLLMVPLPAGAGVREAVLILMLAGSIGRSGAITVSLVSRMLILVVEIGLAGAFGVRKSAAVFMAKRSGPEADSGAQ